ncbi:MAG: hypothetical protein Kow00105_16580 [Phycisphaeraceae bacterium]
MPTDSTPIDTDMEQASQALASMDYLTCEALCLKALAEARRAERFSDYARILLPLQEARRQRRIIALSGDIVLGTDDKFDPGNWLSRHPAGCVTMTRPHSAEDARQLCHKAREQRQYVEVLFADNESAEPTWTLRAYDGPAVSCDLPAPSPATDPARWFLEASEKLGDAALADVDPTLTGVQLVDELQKRLNVFTDHELLHQRLADSSRRLRSKGHA